MSWFTDRSRPIVLDLRVQLPGPELPLVTEQVAVVAKHRITIPVDLIYAAYRQLFPVERMVVFGGHRTKYGLRMTSAVDVTEARPSVAYVRACSARLAQALLDFERSGAHLALWLHSHPGSGISATCPSQIDRQQERLLREHYSPQLLCAIATVDGYLRFWGFQRELRLKWSGTGITEVRGEKHVYKLALA